MTICCRVTAATQKDTDYIIDEPNTYRLFNHFKGSSKDKALEIVHTIKRYALEIGVNPTTMLAIAINESGLNYKAIGPGKYSQGLMQVNTRYHLKRFNKSPLDLDDNIRVGALVLKDCQNRFKGNLEKTIYCYRGLKDKPYLDKIVKNKQLGIFKLVQKEGSE